MFSSFDLARSHSGPTFRALTVFVLSLGLSGALLADSPLESIDLPSDSGLFARQGPAVITQADFDAYLERLPEEHRGGFLLSNERIGQVLQNLVLVRLLAAQALEEGLYENEVTQANLYQASMVFLADVFRRDFLSDRELDDYSDLARELYLTRSDLFQAEPTVSFAHILIWRGRGRGELDAMESIFALYEQLQGGADFEELATQYSDDPEAEETGGKYRHINIEELEENFAQAVSMMEPGQISEPVLTDYGWHIIRLDEKHEGEKPEWEDVREKATRFAREQHQKDLLERLYRRLLNAHPIEVTPEAVDTLLRRHGVRDSERPTTEAIIEHAQDDNQ